MLWWLNKPEHTWRIDLSNKIVLTSVLLGLAIIADTYSNHNGPHNHQHPYISAMVNNGTLTYDHDRLVTKVKCDFILVQQTHPIHASPLSSVCTVPCSETVHIQCWEAVRWSSETCNMRPGLPLGVFLWHFHFIQINLEMKNLDISASFI